MTRRLRMRSRRGFALFLALLLCLGILPTTGFAGDTVTVTWFDMENNKIQTIQVDQGVDQSAFYKDPTLNIEPDKKYENYVFAGWDVNADGDGNLTAQGRWNPILSFDKNRTGDVTNMPDSMTAEVYDEYGSSSGNVEISIPEKEPSALGADFLGWAETPTGAVKYKHGAEDDGEVKNKITFGEGSLPKVLYARWKEIVRKVTLRYNGNENTGGVAPQSVTVDQDSEVTISDKGTLVKDNCKFLGWSENQNATTPDSKWAPNEKVNLNEDTTLYAIWAPLYTVTYTWNGLPDGHGQTLPTGGSYAEDDAVTVDSRAKDDEITVGGKTYVFSGWSTEDATITDGKFTMPGKTVEITGRWVEKKVPPPTPETITITWLDGYHPSGSDRIDQKTAEKGTVTTDNVKEKVTYPDDPARSGYEFTGWGDPVADEDGNITITAQWRRTPRPDPDPEPERPKPEDPKPEDPKPEEPKPEEPKPEEPQPETPTPDPLPERPVDPDTGMVPYDPAVILEDLVPLAAPHLNVTDHFAYIIGYPDGMVKPTGNITRAEAATIFLRLMLDEYRRENWSTENDFSDVDAGAWYNNAVSTCAKAGIIQGYPDGTFRPNANITRAEFAAIAARFVSEDVPGYDYFTDMNGHWAQKDVARAVMAGWIRGDGRTFRPQDRMSRAETATLVNRMINRFPDKEHLLAEMIRWPDNLESDWFYEDVQEATNSHDYEGGALTLAEVWTELLDNRDWAALEVQWAAAGDAPGGEVAPELQNGAQ